LSLRSNKKFQDDKVNGKAREGALGYKSVTLNNIEPNMKVTILPTKKVDETVKKNMSKNMLFFVIQVE